MICGWEMGSINIIMYPIIHELYSDFGGSDGVQTNPPSYSMFAVWSEYVLFPILQLILRKDNEVKNMMPDLGGGHHPDSQHTEIDEESEHTPQVPNSPEPSPLGDRGWLMKRAPFDAESLDAEIGYGSSLEAEIGYGSSNDLQSSPPGELIKRFLSSPKDGEAEQLPPESLEPALAEEEILAEEPELPPEISEPTEPTESTEPTGTSQVFKSSEAKRMKSREWHKKFVSKGVERNPKKGPTSKAKAAPKSKVAPKPKVSARDKYDGKSLVQVKDQWIREWIEDCSLPPSNERRSLAIKAWMESSVRADLMAGRAGVQK